MDRIAIRGGVPLKGEVEVSGAKNSVLPIMAAALLTDQELVIRRVPNLRDVTTQCKILESLGASVSFDPGEGVLRICAGNEDLVTAPWDLVRTMRASVCVLGPLLAKRGRARVAQPGGCVFGVRPIDRHLHGLECLGAHTELRAGYIEAEAKQLRGATIYLGTAFGSSVLGTANVLMAATLGRGITHIESAAMEPEIADLCNFLNACGAKISGIGSHLLTVAGVETLQGCEWSIIPDRIEAATFLTALVMTNSDVTVANVEPLHMLAVLDRLQAAGARHEMGKDWVRNLPRKQDRIASVDVTTLPYPGFPTDIQAQFMSLMAIADGVSVITEKVYPERFIHAAELMRLGAMIRREGPSAIVHGTRVLAGAPVMASDLRASASLVLMGLVCDGQTDVRRVYHIDRGYERIEQKFQRIGADIERIREG
jgi:UDP-N-acetylglucosamine 1-carboxyvinyltransferase